MYLENIRNWNNTACCICGEHLWNGHFKELSEIQKEKYFGNNPWPVNNDPNARCCDFCNSSVVIPERIKKYCVK